MPGLRSRHATGSCSSCRRPGSHCWRGRTGYRVDRVEAEETPPRVHFYRDPAWEENVRADLLDDHFVEGAQPSDDGTWQFHVAGPTGPVSGAVSSGHDCEVAIGQAVEKARAQLGPSR